MLGVSSGSCGVSDMAAGTKKKAPNPARNKDIDRARDRFGDSVIFVHRSDEEIVKIKCKTWDNISR